MSKFYNEEKNSESKPTIRNRPVEAKGDKENMGQGGGPSHIVRIKSFRVRFLDLDNLYGGCKFLIDSLRGANVIPDDDPQSIKLEVSQEKVKGYANEKTEVEVKCVR